MAYSAEVVKRARARLAQAKEDRESENRQHLDEAYAKVPRLREIDRQLRLTMAMAAQAVFSSGGDVNEALEKAKQQNLSYSGSVRNWFGCILRKVIWTTAPSATAAAAAAM